MVLEFSGHIRSIRASGGQTQEQNKETIDPDRELQSVSSFKFLELISLLFFLDFSANNLTDEKKTKNYLSFRQIKNVPGWNKGVSVRGCIMEKSAKNQLCITLLMSLNLRFPQSACADRREHRHV